MNLFNLKKLIQDLKEDTIPQKHYFNYFLIYLILTSLSALSFQVITSEELWLENIEIVITTIIGTVFTIHYYDLFRDAKKESKFFDYYFSIGFVFTLRFLVFGFFLAIPIGVIFGVILSSLPEEYNIIVDDYGSIVLIPIIMIIYFLILLKWFKKVLASSEY